MVRRTITLPENVDALIRQEAADGESFSAAAVRLILEGAKRRGRPKVPSYVGSGKGPRDLGRMAERYLREPIEMR